MGDNELIELHIEVKSSFLSSEENIIWLKIIIPALL